MFIEYYCMFLLSVSDIITWDHIGLSHTAAHVVCFRSYDEFLGTRHRDLLPPRVSPIQFACCFAEGVRGRS